MEIKKDIMWRVSLSFLFICAMGLAIFIQICRIQFVEGKKWIAKADSLNIALLPIEASRGNIFSADNDLIATSIPDYTVRMDTRADGLTDQVFENGVDSLAICLADLFKDRPVAEYKHSLKSARAEGERFYLVHRNVRYHQLQQLKKFPLFRLGRYKGGMMVEQRNIRAQLLGNLASRTIGTMRDVKPVGIEAAFNPQLEGTSGRRLMQRISGNVWVPLGDKDEVESKDGNDVITTLDVNIQDVAEQSLLFHLNKHNADHGCAVLMEVATGEIKAIANLKRNADGGYDESFNYVIAEATEPGSTMKLASLLAGIDDGYIEPNDTVFVGNGHCTYFGQSMNDSHAPKAPKLSVQQVFESSSNVGVSRLIYEHYAKHPEAFVSKLKSFHLDQPLGLQISGEGAPRIKDIKDKDWSSVTLPWMSIGYEVKLTPLQILTFYNAVANNGRMVKPKFVREIRNHGHVVEKYPTEVIADSIASPSSLEKVRRMMEGVVEHGTASVLNTSPYKIAGKTGTAQVNYNRFGFDRSHMTYQASFVGYFPADNPKYSCMVVVYAPGNDVYFGGAVAAPVFKDIADKVYSNHLEFRDKPLETDSNADRLPLAKAGWFKDLQKVCKHLQLPETSGAPEASWVAAATTKTEMTATERKTTEGLVPNVLGMGIRDAIYLLENCGLQVRASGKGMVVRQSLDAGSRYKKGQQIVIELS